MKNTALSFVIFLFCIDVYAQAPGIEWQNGIGGNDYEGIGELILTADGGYIIAGSSYSGISGDKTEANKGNIDYWVVKLDIDGNIEWQNTIGGNGEDLLYAIEETNDGGFILGGNSASTASGDKTEGKLGPADLWIIKLDINGNIVWQNTIGGNGYEYCRDIHQLSDGNYIVGAMSGSNISGDKTENRMGPDDLWILKLDTLGNIIWQNTIGGSSTEGILGIYETSDNNFLVGAYSFSNANFDKTEPNIGQSDYWLLKLNASGNIIWQNTIGGISYDDLYSMDPTSDGGVILGGYSLSPASGDKSESAIGGIHGDFWVVKTDSLGNVEWENTIGGNSPDGVQNIQQTSTGQYIIAGYSQSCISGDHTDICMGGTDYWIVKLDVNGNVLWNNTLGGNFEEKPFSIRETLDNGYIIGGLSTSNINGDKTEPLVGGIAGDIWVVKLFPDCSPTTEICNSLDDNCNGLIDDGVLETINITASGATTFCQGNNVTLNATYTGTSVQWFKNGEPIPGATSDSYVVTQSGLYTCLTSSICNTVFSNAINIIVNKNPKASISAGGPTTFCAGGSVVLTEIAVAGCTYQWYKGANPIAGATALTYTAATAGNYKCRVTKTATGCYKNSNVIAVIVPCKEGEALIGESNTSFSIYPNPNNGTFILSVESIKSEGEYLQIYNALGQLIYAQQINVSDNNFTQTISLNNISCGIYFIRMGDANNYSEQKLIIE